MNILFRKIVNHATIRLDNLRMKVQGFRQPSGKIKDAYLLRKIGKYCLASAESKSPPPNSTINPSVRINKTVWAYWRQGVDNAPKIVRKCLCSTQQMAEKIGYDFIVINEKNMHDYITLPEHVDKKHVPHSMGEAHYSDLLRIALLAEYGGIWVDATLYATNTIPEYLLNQDLFLFQSPLFGKDSYGVCSSWFIIAKKGNYLVTRLRDSLYKYWETERWLKDYFLFHIMLTWLVLNDKECKKIWDRMPYVSNQPPHIFQYSFYKKYTEDIYAHILNSCFVHKLTYRVTDDKDNILYHFLNQA